MGSRIEELDMTPKPNDLCPNMPFLSNTFGKFELEFAAVFIVLWHLEQKLSDWQPIDVASVVNWANNSTWPLVEKIRKMPFAKPDFVGLREQGFVSGWTTFTDPGQFTERGLERLQMLVERTKARSEHYEKTARVSTTELEQG
jgi:hypothetical protein